MEEQEYTRLVRRLELRALEHPQRFRRQVLWISILAYGGLALALALLLVGVKFGGDTIAHTHNPWLAFKLLLVCLALLGIALTVLRAFLSPIPAPRGREITAEEAPRLFALIERVREKLQGPPLHRVIIDDSFNAAIAQVPRFGLFGGHRNHLIIGLPYLFGVSSREMLATLAHEYGHIVGSDGKFGAWVYRQRRTFGALAERVGRSQGFLDRVLDSALGRFAPYFNAYTFVLSRENEYQADAVASRLAGPSANASGLCREALLGPWFAREFWSRLHAQASERPEPAFYPYSALATAFTASYPDWCTQERLGKALAERSDLLDTHPCLRDRLHAIGRTASLPPPVEKSAAAALLGNFTTTLAREFDQAWWNSERAAWQSRFRAHSEQKSKVRKYANLPLNSLNAFELQEYANALAGTGKGNEARPVLEQLLARPDGPYPRARLLLGRLMLKERDRRGLEQLATAAAEDHRLAEECVRNGYQFMLRLEGEEAAETWARELLGEG